MKCYNHSDREAVATCKFCGKALCKECADTYNEPMCDECARQYIESTFAAEKRYLIVHSLIGIALAAAGVYLIGNAWGLLAFFMAFGWIKRDAEDRINDTIGYSGNNALGYMIGNIIGFFFKLAICTVLGIFMFIKRLVILVQDYKYVREVYAQSFRTTKEVAA